ncbi:MAG: rod shape-determining protein MreC [Clostridia bacterium]|nr:rod shape-determining protein MreC [Clostridia bacterium]
MGISFALVGGNSSLTGTNFAEVITSPVQGFFTSIGNGVGGFFEFIGQAGNYKEENKVLRDEVDAKEQTIRELESYQQENQRLRALLELKESYPQYDMVGCEVIAKEPGNWFHVFTIDKGKNYNIKKDDVVVTHKGLVGRVSQVGENWAKVVSLIDTESSVGALLPRTQDIAIVDGDLALSGNGQCRLSAVSNTSALAAGDEVETSGLGGVYPKGLLIGTIKEVINDAVGYSSYAIVDTAVDFEHVREVLVIRMPQNEIP